MGCSPDASMLALNLKKTARFLKTHLVRKVHYLYGPLRAHHPHLEPMIRKLDKSFVRDYEDLSRFFAEVGRGHINPRHHRSTHALVMKRLQMEKEMLAWGAVPPCHGQCDALH